MTRFHTDCRERQVVFWFEAWFRSKHWKCISL